MASDDRHGRDRGCAALSDPAAIAEVALVAAELRRLPHAAIVDVRERVHRDQHFAGRLERAAAALAAAMSPDTRQVTPRTERPRDRRRLIVGPKGRVVVESRGP